MKGLIFKASNSHFFSELIADSRSLNGFTEGFIKIDSFLGGVVVVAEIMFSVILIFGSKYMRAIFHEVRVARSKVSRQIANVSGGTKDAYFFGHQNYFFLLLFVLLRTTRR